MEVRSDHPAFSGAVTRVTAFSLVGPVCLPCSATLHQGRGTIVPSFRCQARPQTLTGRGSGRPDPAGFEEKGGFRL